MGSAVMKKDIVSEQYAPAVMSADQAVEALESTYPESQRFLSHMKKTDAEKMTIALQVLTRIREGKTLKTIGSELGFSHVTAMHYKNLALATIATPLVEEARKHEMELIDQRIEKVRARADAGDPKYEELLRKYLDSRSRLTGTQKPTQVTGHVTISRADQEVASLLDGVIEGEVVEDHDLPINQAPDIAEVLSIEGEVE